jgi:hypothetical protein
MDAMPTGPTEPTGPTGYVLTLPPGWERIPVRDGTDEAIRDILDRAFGHLPADRYGPIRRELAAGLAQQVMDAREAHGLDLYLPVGGIRGLPVAASFAVAHLPPGSADDEPAAVLGALADGFGTATAAEVASTPALRVERAVPSDPGRQHNVDLPTKRVDYVVPVPGNAGWLLVTFSVAADESAAAGLADALVELFDAVVSTLRWRTG